jgi:hypothetical protein
MVYSNSKLDVMRYGEWYSVVGSDRYHQLARPFHLQLGMSNDDNHFVGHHINVMYDLMVTLLVLLYMLLTVLLLMCLLFYYSSPFC